jgi:hypothetical protein
MYDEGTPMQSRTPARPVRNSERLIFRCSSKIATAIRAAAEREEATPSELVRRIVRERLLTQSASA